jgi:CDP-diacylglycerol--glycerol-3-phosphate 3-phosphatidyltransferase
LPPDVPARRPLITANQVTVARLLPMPLVAWIVYQRDGDAWWWFGLALATVIGATDYVDGWLARQQGPTVLGGLLDPIADKVFIALIYLPLADLGYLPPWLVGLMFVREFLVTAMRSAYAYRGVTFATSYLAKMKTWVQMHGVGLIILIALVSKPVMIAVIVAQLVIPAIAVAVIWVRKRRHWVSGTATIGFIAILLALYQTDDHDLTRAFALGVIVLLTWASGADYLIGRLPELKRAKPWGRADGVRLVGGLLLPIGITAALGWSAAPAAPVLALAALELAVGGLDNLLAVTKEYSRAVLWGVRPWGAAILCGAAALATPLGLPALATIGPWAALGLCAAGVAREFWRGRARYL